LYLFFNSEVLPNMANVQIKQEKVTQFLHQIKDEFKEDINVLKPTLESLSMLDDWILRGQVYTHLLLI